MTSSHLSIRIVLANGAILGPTKMAVLEAIMAKGSITAAARSLEISYRYAWRLVQSINDTFSSPAVVTEVGGSKHGGTKLTATGTQIIAIYNTIQRQAHTASVNEIHALNAMSRKRKPSTTAVEPTEKFSLVTATTQSTARNKARCC
jgi:molybdate transport system regulatory protein